MRTVLTRASGGLLAAALVAGAACGGDDDTSDSSDGGPAIVVTSSIVGDVVRQIVGDEVEVEVLMPPGASPHDFAASARQAADMRDAEVLVINGLGFEAGLEDAIDAAEDDGVPVLALAELAPDLLPGGGDGRDPHVFTDPERMHAAVLRLGAELGSLVDGLDLDPFLDRVNAYVDELEALDLEVERLLAPIPPERRVLVTNHDVFGYFADRYGFEVLGTIIPGGDTLAEPSAEGLADLAEAIAESGVPAIFADTSSPTRLADALAAEGTSVEVVELFSESLGEAGSGATTYVELVRTNAQRIAAALG